MQTRTALKRLSSGQIDVDRVSPGGPLAQNAGWLLEQHERRTAETKSAQRRHASAAAMPVLTAARKKAEELLRDQVMPDDTPIVTRFDAFSAIKDASRKNPDDMSLRKLALHLERLWHAAPLDSLTVGAMSHLREHYQNASPRSIVGETIDTVIPKVSFKTLPVAKLVRIASGIATQEDYDLAVERNGLHGDDPISVRARTFIRELVNRSAKVQVSKTPKTETKGVGKMRDVSHAKTRGVGKTHGKDIAERVAHALSKDAATMPEYLEESAEGEKGQFDKLKEVKTITPPDVVGAVVKSKDPDLGVGGTGVMPRQAEGVGLRHEALLQLAASGDKLPCANFDPKINAQQSDQVAVPECGCEALESDKEFKQVRKKAVGGGQWTQTSDMAKQLYDMAAAGDVEAAKLVDQAEQQATERAPDAVGKLYQQHLPLETTRTHEINIMMSTDKNYAAKVQAIVSKAAPKTKVPVTPARPVQPVGPTLPGPAPFSTTVPGVPAWGMPSRKLSAITPDNPLVDDGGHHFPISSFELAAVSRKTASEMTKSPSWWLGSVDELKKAVATAIDRRNKEAKLPPSLEQFKFKKKTDGKGKKGNPFAKGKGDKDAEEKCAKLNKTDIENVVVTGKAYKAAGYSISINKNDVVELTTKTGSKKYPLVDLDSAITDFMYLVDTAGPTHTPPPPMFFIREGLRMQCPGCSEVNSYEMPKTAADLSCGNCHVIIPSKVVAAALGNGTINEEMTLVAITPNTLQADFGDKFAKAAEMLGADSADADGCRAEAYALNVSTEKLVAVWDFMVEAGFQPLAQFAPPVDGESVIDEEPGSTHEMEETDELDAAERLEGISDEVMDIADELKGMEHHGQAGPVPPSISSGGMTGQAELPAPPAMAEDGESLGLGGAADEEVVRCAMTHYKNTGLGVVDAIGQFQKDYMKEKKDESGNITAAPQFEQSVIVKMAAEIYGLDAVNLGTQMELGMAPGMEGPGMEGPGMEGPEVEAPVEEVGGTNLEQAIAEEDREVKARKRKKAELPLPKVNQQQPDSVQPAKLGPDTEQEDYVPSPGKIKTQTGKPQGGSSSTTLGEDSDKRDPGTFGAEAPKAQHPITDQSGVSLPATELGTDSDSGDNAVTKDMVSRSKAAPETVRSK